MVTLIALLAVAACKPGTKNLCSADSQCAPGFACDPSTGACACAGDSSCAAAEFCNPAGFCQPRLRCEGTAGCATGSICDSQSGTCIPDGTCTQDVQCKQGEVCDAFTCVPGCRASGDCPLPQVCRDCPAGTPVAQCPVHRQCVQGPCDSELSCKYGQLCAPRPGDTSGDKYCQDDTRGPYCEPCANTPGTPYSCDTNGQDFCLIDTSKPEGQAVFCGVDCSQGQQCPNGYICRNVRVVTNQRCDPSRGLSACASPATNPPCDPAKNHTRTDGVPGIVNDDCLAVQPPLVGAVCDPGTRRCTAQCLTNGETSLGGYCTCLQDSDCPQDTCVSSTRTCAISGRPCIPGDVPDDCQAGRERIFCEKEQDARLGDVGRCNIGRNCAPAPGFTCATLRGP